MSMPERDMSSSRLRVLVGLCREQAVGLAAHELEQGLGAVTARLAATEARNRRVRRAAPLLLLAVVGVVLGLSDVWSTRELPPLDYAVQGGVVLDGGYLREVEPSGVRLTFEEGTHFALAPGTRARLRAVTASGAHLGLESGEATFEVTPNPQRKWEVEAGPFSVLVKGTAFDVEWDPSAEHFRLDLRHGVVVVTGPLSGGQLELRAGQRLAVDLGKGETKIKDGFAAATSQGETPHEPGGQADDGHAQPASDEPAESAVVTALSAPGPAARAGTVTKRDWPRHMARGEWATIVTQAEQMGFQAVYATASAEDLFTLGNAARYRGRNQLARESLLALQRRYAQSARAIDSLFLLGRLDEARGDLPSARAFYDEYLARSPRGAYAAEALGRKMTLLARSLGPDKARAAAEQYLQKFPNGSYARSARAVLEAR